MLRGQWYCIAIPLTTWKAGLETSSHVFGKRGRRLEYRPRVWRGLALVDDSE